MFLATPWLVDIKMLDTRYKLHAQRVAARRAGVDPREARKARKGAAAPASLKKKPVDDVDDEIDDVVDDDVVDDDVVPAKKAPAKAGRAMAGSAPRPGSRPGSGRATPRKRQGGKRR